MRNTCCRSTVVIVSVVLVILKSNAERYAYVGTAVFFELFECIHMQNNLLHFSTVIYLLDWLGLSCSCCVWTSPRYSLHPLCAIVIQILFTTCMQCIALAREQYKWQKRTWRRLKIINMNVVRGREAEENEIKLQHCVLNTSTHCNTRRSHLFMHTFFFSFVFSHIPLKLRSVRNALHVHLMHPYTVNTWLSNTSVLCRFYYEKRRVAVYSVYN